MRVTRADVFGWLRLVRRGAFPAASDVDPGVATETATLSTLRKGYTYRVRVIPRDILGGASETANPSITGSGVHTSVTQDDDAGDPMTALVAALSSGPDLITFGGVNALFDAVAANQAITVLDANRFEFDVDPDGLRLYPKLDFVTTFARVNATARDARELDGQPAYSLSSILWSSAGEKVLFSSIESGGGGWTSTLADAMSAYITPNIAGTETVTVSATNSLGQQITGTFTVHVIAATSAEIVLQRPAETETRT